MTVIDQPDTSQNPTPPRKSALEQTRDALEAARGGEFSRASFVRFMLDEVGVRYGVTHNALGTTDDELRRLDQQAQDEAKLAAVAEAISKRTVLDNKDAVPALRIAAEQELQQQILSGQVSINDIRYSNESEAQAKRAMKVSLRRAHIQAAIDLQDSIPGDASSKDSREVAQARKEYAEHLRQGRMIATFTLYHGASEDARDADPEGHAERHVEELKIVKDAGSGFSDSMSQVRRYAEINKVDGWRIFATTEQKQAGISADDVKDKIEAIFERAKKLHPPGGTLNQTSYAQMAVSKSTGTGPGR